MSLVTGLIPTAQASSFTLQYFPYYVWCYKYFCIIIIFIIIIICWVALLSFSNVPANTTFSAVRLP